MEKSKESRQLTPKLEDNIKKDLKGKGFEDADCSRVQWRTQEFCSWGGGQQIRLRTEDRENRDLGAVAPSSGVLEAAVIWYKKFHFI